MNKKQINKPEFSLKHSINAYFKVNGFDRVTVRHAEAEELQIPTRISQQGPDLAMKVLARIKEKKEQQKNKSSTPPENSSISKGVAQ